MNYLQQRLKALGLSDEYNQLPEDVRPKEAHAVTDWRYFREDGHGNIEINYYTLQGGTYTFKKQGAKWDGIFKRIRYAPGNEPESAKGEKIRYTSPRGSGMHPFFTPKVVQAYRKMAEIETLYLVEGEFKAFAGDMAGLMIIGIPSIHGFYGEDNKDNNFKTLHPDIVELVLRCKVKNLVYLSDADTLTVKWREDKEMSQRPKAFYSAVNNFRKTLNYLMHDPAAELENVHFMHLRDKYNDTAKGLDDLLQKFPDEKERKDILRDLRKNEKAEKYFQGLRLNSDYTQSLIKYFGLDGVKKFYATYGRYLQERRFVFNNAVYAWDGENPRFLHHKDVGRYLRIGPDWMKLIHVPNKFQEPEEQLVKWNISEIIRDYKRFPGFESQIPKYDAFCNVPDWTSNFQRVHEVNDSKSFNLANPMPHEPRVGKWPTIYNFLKHIFQGEGAVSGTDNPRGHTIECAIESDPFTVAMDWININYRYPTQMLPVPILVSPENNTGKSTFLKFIQSMFGTSNSAILTNDLFKMQFNSHYITKHFIMIDESFLEVDKKAEKERLKQLVTADMQFLQFKGVDLKKFPYFGKVIMASNDADSVMKMEDAEDRWFVVRVPKIPQDKKDPDMEVKMKREIPAFLHFLSQRQIAHPRQDRLWFKPRHFITDQFKSIVANTKDFLSRQIESFIEDQLLTYSQAELHYDVKTLHEELNKRSKFKFNENDIREKLKKHYKLMPQQKSARFKVPVAMSEGVGDELAVEWTDKVGRYFTFKAEEWLSETDFKTMTNGQSQEPEKEAVLSEADDQDDDLPF